MIGTTKSKFSWKKLSLCKRQMIMGYVFVVPWVIGFVLFFGSNLIQTIIYSFNELTINPEGGYTLKFLGWENFKTAIVSHGTFNRVLVESIGEMIIDVPLIIFFSLFIAILINKKFHGRAFVRAVLFLPIIMMAGAIMQTMDSSLTQMMGGISSVTNFQAEAAETAGLNAGYLFEFLKEFGMPEKLINYVIDAIARIYEIVRASGVQILIFLAALQSVSPALYEVSKIEGATAYETFWKITFPLVSPLIITNMVYTIVDLYSRTAIIKLASDTAFASINFGLSAAMSIMSSLIVCLVLVISTYLISKKVFYQH